jgi:hypothetical protein
MFELLAISSQYVFHLSSRNILQTGIPTSTLIPFHPFSHQVIISSYTQTYVITPLLKYLKFSENPWTLQSNSLFLHANELTDGWQPLGGFRMGASDQKIQGRIHRLGLSTNETEKPKSRNTPKNKN